MLPRREWWKMAAVEWIAIFALSQSQNAYETPLALLASTLLPWSIYAMAMLMIGRHGRHTPATSAVPRLLACGALAALLNAIALNDPGSPLDDLTPSLAGYALGDLAGVVLVLPVLLALSGQWGPDRRR